MTRPKTILIAGPTASGKSALALDIATRVGGVVINADSMQVYRELRVLTARPSLEEEACVPHRLYGHIGAAEAYSVARWLEDVAGELAAAVREGRRAIIVGGTGLYFKALTEGLAPVPEIAPDVRRHWRRRAGEIGAAALHVELRARDPAMAARLAPGDTQRITRALEVIDSTGRSLAAWQAERHAPLLDADRAVRLVVERGLPDLVARADRRFIAMLESGALAEVAALRDLRLAPDAPVMRALGVRPILGLLAGTSTRAAAVEAGQRETRQYIKRQLTWLKRNMIAWKSTIAIFNCLNDASIMQIIDEC